MLGGPSIPVVLSILCVLLDGDRFGPTVVRRRTRCPGREWLRRRVSGNGFVCLDGLPASVQPTVERRSRQKEGAVDRVCGLGAEFCCLCCIPCPCGNSTALMRPSALPALDGLKAAPGRPCEPSVRRPLTASGQNGSLGPASACGCGRCAGAWGLGLIVPKEIKEDGPIPSVARHGKTAGVLEASSSGGVTGAAAVAEDVLPG